jgi:preprotein translocase subunit YajC
MKEIIEAMTRAYQEVTQGAILESHFKVGDEVVCKASGMEGEVVAVDQEQKGKYYTVKREDGKTMKYSPDELELEDEDEDEDMDEASKCKTRKEAMDPVGQADADINNDGKVNSTDKYLHNRRKAIKKSIKKKGEDDPEGNKGETAVMNPKAEQKESTIRDKLLSVLEKKDHGNTEQKQAYDDNWSPSAKKMAADHKPEVMADVKKATDDNAKAEKQAKVSPKNPTDKSAPADSKIVNPVDDITKQGGMKESFASMVKGIAGSYAEMYAPKVEESTEIMEDAEQHRKMAAAHKEKMLDAKEEDHRDGMTAHRMAHDAHMAAAKEYDKAPDSHTATKAKIAGQKAMDHSKKANSVFE